MGGSSRTQNPPPRQKKDSFWEKGVSRRMSELDLRAESDSVYRFKKTQKYFHKTLDNILRNKYINKAPEGKRFTEPQPEGKHRT